MDQAFMHLLATEFDNDGKRKMGRPPKIPPFSHYSEYKFADIEFFISLIGGREELYNPCEEFNESRQMKFIFLEKKCQHFLAMRKGRNAEKLWHFLFNDFEKEYRNRTKSNSQKSSTGITFAFYRSMEFLIPFLDNEEISMTCFNRNKATSSQSQNFRKRGESDLNNEEETDDGYEMATPAKHLKAEENERDDWFMKVLETVTKPEASQPPARPHEQQREQSPPPIPTKNENTSIGKHADIISCVNTYLDNVSQDKLMLCKVRLFQFIEEEKNKLKNGAPFSLGI